MNAYLTGLIAMSALVGVSSYVSYGENRDKYLKAASSLILIYIIISPTVTLVREAAEFKDYSGSVSEYIGSIDESEFAESAEAAFCEGIEKYVCEKFSLSEDEVYVRAFGFDCKNMKAEKIKIILSGSAALSDNRAIAEEVRNNGLGECEVELSVK